jgi:hypothetical protein
MNMTTVYCQAYACKYYKPHDEDYGICCKDHITLDENVALVFKGCPDAEFRRVRKGENGEYELV